MGAVASANALVHPLANWRGESLSRASVPVPHQFVDHRFTFVATMVFTVVVKKDNNMAIKSKAMATPQANDAVSLLKADHKKVKGLFENFQKLCKADAPGEEKGEVAAQICKELTIHAQAEEEVFYTALRGAGVDMDVMDEADVEHAGAKELIAQISSMQPNEPLYDAKVTVLGEYIDHHVKEEEGVMFSKAKKAKVNMEELGDEIASRKAELLDLFEAEIADGKNVQAIESEDDDSVGAAPPRTGKNRGSGKSMNGSAGKSR